MVGQDGFELIEVLGLQQAFYRACRQCSKSRIGRGEHRKGSVTAQHLLQTGGLDRSDQRGEVAVSGSFIDNGVAVAMAVVTPAAGTCGRGLRNRDGKNSCQGR